MKKNTSGSPVEYENVEKEDNILLFWQQKVEDMKIVLFFRPNIHLLFALRNYFSK